SPSPSPSPTPTPTPTPTPSPTPTPAPYSEYTVEPGDTLVAIVSRFRPDGADFEDFAARIIDINDIDDPGSLSVGQVLLIPEE
ncbi:MAG: LysM peptidoglycan-binding domain-containing protein, partial [Chloroflexi bacterium]|nr:LysM peptidoglycan-binding domain-containing protein [Chloroflexota bacterium]